MLNSPSQLFSKGVLQRCVELNHPAREASEDADVTLLDNRKSLPIPYPAPWPGQRMAEDCSLSKLSASLTLA